MLSDQELIDELHNIEQKSSTYPPRETDMMKYGDHSTQPYYRAFGSWSNALAAAGYEDDRSDFYEKRNK